MSYDPIVAAIGLQSRVQPLWNRPVTNPGDPGWEEA